MTTASRTFRINVTAALPSDLPAKGNAMLIAPAGAHQAVRHAVKTENQFNNTTFFSYGSGILNPYYSELGAYVITASGGHRHQETFGATIFDLTDRQWKSLACPQMPERNTYVVLSETNGQPWIEMLGTEVPAPTHTFRNMQVVSPANGGGPKGGIIFVGRGACCSESLPAKSSHIFDCDTGLWRRATEELSPVEPMVEVSVVHDPVTNRYYHLARANNIKRVWYLDGADWTFKTSPSWPNWGSSPMPTGRYSSWSYFESGGKRMLLSFWGARFQAIDLDDFPRGIINLPYTGEFPIFYDDVQGLNLGTQGTWAWHQKNGVLYHRLHRYAGNAIDRLTPPAGDPFSGTWTVDSVSFGGDPVPEHTLQTGGVQYGAYGWLRYVPALEMLVYVTPNGVALLNP